MLMRDARLRRNLSVLATLLAVAMLAVAPINAE